MRKVPREEWVVHQHLDPQCRKQYHPWHHQQIPEGVAQWEFVFIVEHMVIGLHIPRSCCSSPLPQPGKCSRPSLKHVISTPFVCVSLSVRSDLQTLSSAIWRCFNPRVKAVGSGYTGYCGVVRFSYENGLEVDEGVAGQDSILAVHAQNPHFSIIVIHTAYVAENGECFIGQFVFEAN